jgi:hypothetical protein
MNPLIVVLGLSDSGKDTFADVALTKGYQEVFKWVGGVKRAIEHLYYLPLNALEEDVYRHQLVPGKDYTYLNLLVMLYKENVTTKPLALSMFKDAAKWQLRVKLMAGKSIIITDTRQPEELEFINTLAKEFPVAFVRITGRGVERESDVSLSSNVCSIDREQASYWTIQNKHDVGSFRQKCAMMVSAIGRYHAGLRERAS